MTLVDGVPENGLPADDPAAGSGLAVFEALRTYNRRIFRWEAHLLRLERSAAWFGFAAPDPQGLAAESERALADIPGDAAITITLTGGGRRIVRGFPLDASRVGRPLRVATLGWEPPASLPGFVKHTNRAAWLLAAEKAGVDEVILVDREGCWLELNRSNLFVVRGGVLITPPADGRILEGVTRAACLDAAADAGVSVAEMPIPGGPVEEIYASSTFKELVPVVGVGSAPALWGPVGTALAAAFRRRVNRESGLG